MRLRRLLAPVLLTGLAMAIIAQPGLGQVADDRGSYYVLQPSGIDAEDDGIFGDISGVVSAMSSTGADLAGVTTAVFDDVIAQVNARFPLGAARPLEVPIPDGYNCYAPVGLYFAFDHGGADGIARTLVETIGDIDDVEFRIDYLREVDEAFIAGDTQNQLVGSLAVNVYWRSTPPSLSLEANRTRLWGGDTSALTATLMCGDDGMVDQAVEFSMPIDAGLGSLQPAADDTDDAGLAEAVFSAYEGTAGAGVVEAVYQWSSQDGDVRLTIRDAVDLTTGTLTGTWKVTGKERWTRCTIPEDNGVYSGRGTIHFLQNGNRFTGYGRFPRETDDLSGTIRRTGPNTFVITGTSRYGEVNGQADRDDDEACTRGYSCDTWETYGVIKFRGRGSIETRTIRLTWKGRDTQGDTCVFTGRGKARYRSR